MAVPWCIVFIGKNISVLWAEINYKIQLLISWLFNSYAQILETSSLQKQFHREFRPYFTILQTSLTKLARGMKLMSTSKAGLLYISRTLCKPVLIHVRQVLSKISLCNLHRLTNQGQKFQPTLEFS